MKVRKPFTFTSMRMMLMCTGSQCTRAHPHDQIEALARFNGRSTMTMFSNVNQCMSHFVTNTNIFVVSRFILKPSSKVQFARVRGKLEVPKILKTTI